MDEMIFDIIFNDIRDAMREKDTLKRDCLRGVISEINNATINVGKAITNDITLKVLQKVAKQRNDSIASFKAGNRMDLVEREEKELELIKKYLPKLYDNTKIEEIVNDIIKTANIPTVKKSIGQIMKAINLRDDKASIDMKYVSQYLNKILT